MNRELEKLKSHKLAKEEIVVGFHLNGNPRFNPKLLDYLIENGISRKEFWDSQDLDNNKLGLKQYYYIFISAYNNRKMRKK